MKWHKSITIFSFGVAACFSLVGTTAIAADLVVRKNVIDLTPEEKTDLVDAITTLKHTTTPGSQTSIYDQFVAVHMGAMSVIHWHEEHQHNHTLDIAHGNSAFLPWHREYIRRFEQALQTVDADVTLPYWDWTDPTAVDVIFTGDFLGTNGQGININVPGAGLFEGGAVLSGNFSAAKGWVLNENLHTNQATGESLGTSLIRFLQVPPASDYPLPKADIERVLALDDYLLFRPALEGFISVDAEGNITPGGFTHNYIHGLVGGVVIEPTTTGVTFTALGTMSSIPSSPNDPVFWLHHANVDRLWAEWQDNGHAGSNYYPATGQPYGHNLNDPMWPWDGGTSTPASTELEELLSLLPVFAPDDIVQPADVLDYRKLGYTYNTTRATVPEPASTLGLFTLVVLGASSRLKRHALAIKNRGYINKVCLHGLKENQGF